MRELRAPAGSMAAAGVVVVLVAWNLTHLPPAVHPDGGFPAGETAGARVDAVLSGAGVDRAAVALLRSLPDFKSTEAVAYPLVRLGRSVQAETPQGLAPGSVTAASPPAAVVLLCDDLFHEAIGAHCGGPAETAAAPDAGGPVNGPLLERFEAAPGRWVSVYGPSS